MLRFGGRPSMALPIAASRSSRPARVMDEHGTTGEPASAVPSSRSSMSFVTSASQSSSTIALGQRDDAVPDAEQVEDRQVFARLRHHAVIGGDDEQRQVWRRRRPRACS